MSHSLNGSTPKVIDYEYDAIGRLSRKKIKGNPSGSQILNLKGVLQAATITAIGSLMTDQLRSQNLIPLQEPYTNLNYTHLGSGGETTTSSVLAVTGNNAIVDWVFVELRSTPTQVVRTKVGLLQRDGDVVEPDGMSPLNFSLLPSDTYYVVLRHRNHLPVMTQNAVTFSGNTTVDFSSSSTLTYGAAGTVIPQANTSQGMALWGGNVDGNYQVSANAEYTALYNIVTNAPGNFLNRPNYVYSGYSVGDVDFSGQTVYTGANTDVTPIYNIISNHPGNFLNSSSFVIQSGVPAPTSYNLVQGGSTSGDYLQVVDLAYHIRGSVNCINCNASGVPTLNAAEKDVFALRLDFHDDNRYYNGQVSKQTWRSYLALNPRSYTYSYDAADRLTAATYAGQDFPGENYSVPSVSYDRNGNLTSLTRRGALSFSAGGVPSSFGLVDQLTYTYPNSYSNQIKQITDAIIGRMMQVDAYADVAGQERLSPYNGLYNSPVLVTDPDGNCPNCIAGLIGAGIGGLVNLGVKAFQGKIGSFKDGLAAFGIGAAAGFVTGFTGGAAAGALGLSTSSVLGGAVAGGAGSVVGSPIQGLGNAAYFGDAYSGGQYLTDIAIGGVVGGVSGGIGNLLKGGKTGIRTSIWTGKSLH
ncbi:hypothetical protein [Larkinella terrae]|uniref:RHS repeat-associated core domain-containing protein n=1 Tax=Larkinella terrae TaxID=2025311 RepID=A0A7K0EI42_9BACT|nr:hypothetical protein [Larkinella terrae]MRS61261.1 hypothetical protein [Larkinella terrae]